MTEHLTSQSFPDGAQCDRGGEAEYRAIRARRNLMEAELRLEGAPESFIARVATDETAAKMIAYENKVVGVIQSLMSGPR